MGKRHALGVLIQETQRANRWSDRDVELRAKRLGLSFSRSNLSKWRNQPVKSIHADSIAVLSEVLGVSRSTVARAVVESMGITLGGGSDLLPEQAIGRDHLLSNRDKETLLTLLNSMRSYTSMDSGENVDTAPKADAEQGSALKTKKQIRQKQLTDAEVTKALQQRDLNEYGQGFL